MRWSCCIGEHFPARQLAESIAGRPLWTARF